MSERKAEIVHLKKIIDRHTSNIRYLDLQIADFGSGPTPVNLLNQRTRELEERAKSQQKLIRLRISVYGLPGSLLLLVLLTIGTAGWLISVSQSDEPQGLLDGVGASLATTIPSTVVSLITPPPQELPPLPAGPILPRKRSGSIRIGYRPLAGCPAAIDLTAWITELNRSLATSGNDPVELEPGPAPELNGAVAFVEGLCLDIMTVGITISLAPSFDPVPQLPENPVLHFQGNPVHTQAFLAATIMLNIGAYRDATSELTPVIAAVECGDELSAASYWVSATSALRQEYWGAAHDSYVCGAKDRRLTDQLRARFLAAATLAIILEASRDRSYARCPVARSLASEVVDLDQTNSAYLILEGHTAIICSDGQEDPLILVTKHVKQVLQQAHSPEAYAVQGLAYFENAKYAEAHVCAEEAIKYATRDHLALPHLLLGMIYARYQDASRSDEHFIKYRERSSFAWQLADAEEKRVFYRQEPPIVDRPTILTCP